MEILPLNPLVLAYLSSNAVALLLAWVSARKPVLGRFMFALLFLWAGPFNWRTVHTEPAVYRDYGELAVLPFYQSFIEGWFSAHVVWLVSLIAIGQLLLGLGLIVGGQAARWSALGGMLFLIAIAPLGMGSAFPSSLLMALGCYFLFRRGYQGNLLQHFTRWIKARSATKEST